MIVGKFGQGRCQACHGWHWALQLDSLKKITQLKCCRCGRLVEYNHVVKVVEKTEDGKK